MKKMFASKGTAGLLFLACVLLLGPAAQVTAEGLPDFTGLVKSSSAAVVNISTTTKVSQSPFGRGPGGPHGRDGGPGAPHGRDGGPGSPFEDFLRRFFGDEYGDIEEFDQKSLGSGFIVTPDGYVLTNNHVIREADEIVVRLSDRREFDAEVIGVDKRSDVALLKIEAEGLPVARIGSSSDLEVGSWVLAIGSPFGFDHTVTAGIVSAKGRSLPNENYVPFIQTDVAINPGNSGGPLFNLDGEVVGINSQIFSRTGGFMGLSFAIPIDMAMNVVEQLRTKGRVTRGWLGILIQDVTRELAESFDMGKPVGALVARVLPGSPAEKAGIEVGDVIVEYNGRQVQTSAALPPMVGSTGVGVEVKVKIIRKGEPMALEVTISELPEDEELKLSRGGGGQDGLIGPLDITVSDLTAEQKQKLDGKNGVYVESVNSGGAGARAGMRKGDVVLRFNNVSIKDADHLRQVVSEVEPGKSVAVLVQRRGSPLFLALKLDEE